MDVTDRKSISAVQKEIQAKEGKLHILINKYLTFGAWHHSNLTNGMNSVPDRLAPYPSFSMTPRPQSMNHPRHLDALCSTRNPSKHGPRSTVSTPLPFSSSRLRSSAYSLRAVKIVKIIRHASSIFRALADS